MLNKALLLAASGKKSSTQVQQPFSRFKIVWAEEDGDLLYFENADGKAGEFTLLSGDPLKAEVDGIVRMIASTSEEGVFAYVSSEVLSGSKVCWLVNETTGEVVYGACGDITNGGTVITQMLLFAWRTRAEVEAQMSGVSVEPSFTDMFTTEDVGKEFTLSIYVDGYGWTDGPEPYSQYDITVGCDAEEPTETDTFGAVKENGVNVTGTVKHVSGASLAMTRTDENGDSYTGELFASFLGGINAFTFPLDTTATSPGIVKYVNETNGNAGYAVYGVAEDGLLGDGIVMAWFATKEDALTFIATGNTDHMEAPSAPLFTKDNIGETHRLSFYLEDGGTEPYSRFSVVSGYDQTATETDREYGYWNDSSKTYGEFTLLDGKDLATNDANGNPVIGVLSSNSLNIITFPEAENSSGICKVVNETTGVEAYGYFGGKMNYARPYYLWVAFKTLADVQKFINDDNSFEYADVFFTADNVGVEQTFSIYILEDGDSGGSEPEWTPPIPTGTHEFEFKASTNASGVNFFTNVSNLAHPTSSFDVSVNDEPSTMSYTSLSFSSGDDVKIVGNDVISFPSLSTTDKDYIAEVKVPLPFMSDVDGNGVTSFANLFSGCTTLETVADGLFANNPEVTTFEKTFSNCSNLKAVPADLFANSTNNTSLKYTFEKCSSLTELPVGLLDNQPNVTDMNYIFSYCSGLTTLPSRLLANTKVSDYYCTFSYCSGLNEIPEDLFGENPNVTKCRYTFQSCRGLTTVPEDLFKNLPNVTQFDGLFRSCTSLTTIPENLFKYNPKVTSFYETFSGCSSVNSIPSGLFSNNTEVTSFYSTFRQCSNLETIPSDLFSKNTKATNFTQVFEYCEKLKEIPAGLFDNNPEVTTFGDWTGGPFKSCKALKSVPEGLFDKLLKLKEVGAIFAECYSLQSVPEGLFAKNPLITDLKYAFRNCKSFSGRLKIGSSVVSIADGFCQSAGAITVEVPANTVTETTFRAVAESLTNLTVETYDWESEHLVSELSVTIGENFAQSSDRRWHGVYGYVNSAGNALGANSADVEIGSVTTVRGETAGSYLYYKRFGYSETSISTVTIAVNVPSVYDSNSVINLYDVTSGKNVILYKNPNKYGEFIVTGASSFDDAQAFEFGAAMVAGETHTFKVSKLV